VELAGFTVKNIVQPAQADDGCGQRASISGSPNQEPRVGRYQDLVNRIRYEGAIAAPSKTSPVNVPATQQDAADPETASKNAARRHQQA